MAADPESGLSASDASARLASGGPNGLDFTRRVPPWRRFLAQFRDPLIYLLLMAIAVSALAWLLDERAGPPIETIVIAAIVLGNGVLGFVQQRSAEQAVIALQRMAAPSARVVRDGRAERVPAERVVPGDLLLLAEGDAIPADGRLLWVAALTVAEAALTGESEPILKETEPLPEAATVGDRKNMVFSGTTVTRGRGRAVVTATGMRTEMGQIADLLERTKQDPTPLQREVDLIGRSLGLAVVAIATVVVATILLTSRIEAIGELVDVLMLGVSLAVAAVPEGLPAVLTVILAIGVQRMARRHAIVKKLTSVEALGSASVICSDKTGTLTRDEMTITRILTHSGQAWVTGIGLQPNGRVTVDGRPLESGALHDEVRAVLGGGSLANDAIVRREDGNWTVHGDPTDAAFLVAERKLATADRRSARFSRRGEIPFSTRRKLMSTLEADAARDGQLALMTKGAPDVLLARCTRERVGTGEEPLTEGRRADILASVERLAGAALRTLAVAYRPLDPKEVPIASEALERDLIFAGVVGMIDPPRQGVSQAVIEAQTAGIRVIMITGDHPRTASRIAEELGIASVDQSAVVSGPEIDAMGDAGLRVAVRSSSVYARVAPEHKLRIIDALRDDGQIVAMTGDGVNDAPALKSADIGVAMGSGTDVAKEAAAMILADDNFATIVAAVREGRGIFANIRTCLRYLLSSNAGEVMTMFIGVVAASVIGLGNGDGFVAPLLATQILWINLLTDSGPAIALGFEPPPPDVMRRSPRRLGDRVVDRQMWRDVLFIGVVMATAALLTLDAYLPGGLIAGNGDLATARTAAFTVLVVGQLFNALNARSERESAVHGLLRNPRLWAAIGFSLALQVLVVHLPFLQAAFGTAALGPLDWVLCVAVASTVLWAEELRKAARRSAVTP